MGGRGRRVRNSKSTYIASLRPGKEREKDPSGLWIKGRQDQEPRPWALVLVLTTCVALSNAEVQGISDGTVFWSETKPYRDKKGNDLEWMTGTDKKVLDVIMKT